MSLKVVAELVGLSAAYLSMVENGKRNLDKYSRICDLAEVLKVPVSELAPELAGAREGQGYLPSAGQWEKGLWDAPADDDPDLIAMQGFRAADRQIGGVHLYAAVLRYLQTSVGPRLFDTGEGSHGRHIFNVASGLTEMVGWMAHDAGRDDTAGLHFRRSLQLAKVGADHELSAHVIASLSHLALHQGYPDRAIGLAGKGLQVLAKGRPNPALTARLFALHARGLAGLPRPDSAAVGRALGQAEKALDKEQPDRPSPWISGFDEGSLASEATRSLHKLGQYAAAARSARRIIETRPGTHARSRAFGQLLLADALTAAGEYEEACAAGETALDAVSSVSSYLVVQHARQLANSLNPQRGNHVVDAYLAAIDDALSGQRWLVS